MFSTCFNCSYQAQYTFIQCWKFTSIDSTFLKAYFVQTLLLYVGINTNIHNLLLAWCREESENRNAWEYFFHYLTHPIPQILDSTILNDCGKGLLSINWVLGTGIAYSHCWVHLKENIWKWFTDFSLIPFLWKVSFSKTELPIQPV